MTMSFAGFCYRSSIHHYDWLEWDIYYFLRHGYVNLSIVQSRCYDGTTLKDPLVVQYAYCNIEHNSLKIWKNGLIKSCQGILRELG